MLIKQRFIVLFLGVFSAVCTLADPVAELREKFETIQTFSASFEQVLSDNTGEALQKTEGKMQLQTPGRFYWQVAPPFEQVIVTDGESLWVYDPDMAQVTVYQKQQLASTPAQLLSGNFNELAGQYQITKRDEGAAQAFVLEPKVPEESNFTRLEFVFDKKGRLETMLLVDKLTQKTQVTFSKQKVNRKLDESLFTFVPPQGTDVIHSSS